MLWELMGTRRSDSNEYPQHMFLWRNVENYPSIITKYPPYLFHWILFRTFTQLAHVLTTWLICGSLTHFIRNTTDSVPPSH